MYKDTHLKITFLMLIIAFFMACSVYLCLNKLYVFNLQSEKKIRFCVEFTKELFAQYDAGNDEYVCMFAFNVLGNVNDNII